MRNRYPREAPAASTGSRRFGCRPPLPWRSSGLRPAAPNERPDVGGRKMPGPLPLVAPPALASPIRYSPGSNSRSAATAGVSPSREPNVISARWPVTSTPLSAYSSWKTCTTVNAPAMPSSSNRPPLAGIDIRHRPEKPVLITRVHRAQYRQRAGYLMSVGRRVVRLGFVEADLGECIRTQECEQKEARNLGWPKNSTCLIRRH